MAAVPFVAALRPCGGSAPRPAAPSPLPPAVASLRGWGSPASPSAAVPPPAVPCLLRGFLLGRVGAAVSRWACALMRSSRCPFPPFSYFCVAQITWRWWSVAGAVSRWACALMRSSRSRLPPFLTCLSLYSARHPADKRKIAPAQS